ncbi:MAG: glycosyltransferase, partial [Patescibacteria group bacterium]|nr:glycosyltransferase [Patescibacteria group bacterium]
GNVYPHKNVEFLMKSFKLFFQSNKLHKKIVLVCVGKEDFFYRNLKKFVENLGISHRVIFLHDVSDDELRALYAYAIALVFPSKSEGFGLPALEALAQNCRIIVSDIPVFRELFGEYARYVEHDERLWSVAFSDALKEQKKFSVPRDFFKKYSWEHLALMTKQSYEDGFRI